ncbi:MAG: hydroxyphenylacetyl-CoA thioesterase PaaI [Ilyomonas sp.]
MNGKKAFPSIEKMLEADNFGKWLGVTIMETKEGYSKIKMTVRKEMLNGFAIAHGGIAFSLADSALAFASNSAEEKTVTIEAVISFLKPAYENDILIATATQKSFHKSINVFDIHIEKENGEMIALFRGTVKMILTR